MTAMHVNTQIAQHQSPKVRTTGQVRGGGGNGGGRVEDGCKGQTSHRCRVMEKHQKVDFFFLKKKTKNQRQLKVFSLCMCSAVRLTPVPFMVNDLEHSRVERNR